jgi:uncharacterized protein YqeY
VQPSPLRQRLELALRDALRARDTLARSVLRSALSAIDNASAVAPGPAAAAVAGGPHFAGTVAGLGAGDTGRRRLGEAEIEDIVRAEIAGRQAAARTYDQTGHRDQAARLRREADLLRPFTGAGDSSQAEAGAKAAPGERPAGRPA